MKGFLLGSLAFLGVALVFPGSSRANESAANAGVNTKNGILEGVVLGPKGGLPEAYVGPGASALKGKTVLVPEFENHSDKPSGDFDVDLKWKDAGKSIADAVAKYAGSAADGRVLFERSKGEFEMRGAVIRYTHPRRAAAWQGWVGHFSGEGELVIELEVADSSGEILVALRQRVPTPVSGLVGESLRREISGPVANFFRQAVE